jgi:hypothetical protein
MWLKIRIAVEVFFLAHSFWEHPLSARGLTVAVGAGLSVALTKIRLATKFCFGCDFAGVEWSL